MSIIIGISGKKQSGKDALCSALIRNSLLRGVRIAFADALKHEVATACGVSVSYIEEHKAHFRLLLQAWGTDFRRWHSGDDYWVKKALYSACMALDNGYGMIVIPDVRFKSEADTLKQADAILVRVSRPSQIIDTHISETDLDDYKGFNHVVLNSGSLSDLDREALVILDKIKHK